MAADLATLAIKVDNRDIDKTQQNLTKLGVVGESAARSVGAAWTRIAGAIGFGAIGAKIIQETIAAQDAQARLEARIRATGGAAGQSIGDLQAYAQAMQRVSTFSDEAVQSAQAMLLNFDQISGRLFPAATKAAVDLAAAMGTDVANAASLIGKALQDPEDGITALNRQFRLFTKEQRDAFGQMVETGRGAEAQAEILRALETRVGGSAAALRNTLGGALKGLANDFGDLFEVDREHTSVFVASINGIAAAFRGLNTAMEKSVGFLDRFFEQIANRVNGLPANFGQMGPGEEAAFQRARGIMNSRGEGGMRPSPEDPAVTRARAAALEMEVEMLAELAIASGKLSTEERALNVQREAYVKHLTAARVPAMEIVRLEAMYVDGLRETALRIRAKTEAEERYQNARRNVELEEDEAQRTLRLQQDAANRLQQAFTIAFQNIAARGKASFADIFNFIASAAPAGSPLGILAGIGGVFASIIDSDSGEFEAAVKRWNDTLDGFVRGLTRHTSQLDRELADIQRFYDDQLAALQELQRGAQLALDTFNRNIRRQPGSNPFGFQGFDSSSRTRELAEAEERLNAAREDAIRLANDEANAKKRNDELSLRAELARAQGNEDAAREIERAQRIVDAGVNSFFVSLLEQIFAAEDAARAMGKLTDNISDLRNVIDSLQEFQDRLNLSNLSPLNPIQQLAEARRQFETMAALALAGDRTAAASLSGSGQAFLESSRGVFASSGGFVSDFQRVQSVIDQVQGRFAGELSLQEQQLNELKGQNKRIEDIAKRAQDQRDAQIAVLADGFTRTIARLDVVAANVDELSAALVRADDGARA